MLGYILKPANLFTAASLFCGLYSVMWSAGATPDESRSFFIAALLIIFAGLFDGLDGRVARLTKTESEFGVQLDSLVDVVSFGVAPGVLLYKWGLEAWGEAGFAVAFLFTLCGVFRLARFNLRAAETQAGGPAPNKKYSEGLTITWSGGMVAVLVLNHAHVRATEVTNHLGVLLLTLFLAYLMISNVRFRTFRELRLSPLTIAGIAAFVGFAVLVLALYGLTSLLVVMGGTYIGFGLLEESFFFARRRRGRDPYYLGEESTDLDDPVEEEDEVTA